MPLEYRLIQFRAAELDQALDQWLRASGELGQYGRIGKTECSQTDHKVSIAVECHDLQSGARKNRKMLVFDEDKIRQALVLYCKNASIPLSQQGKKVIRLLDDKIAMYYALN